MTTALTHDSTADTAAGRTGVPVGPDGERPGHWSRRTFLGTLSALAVGAAAGLELPAEAAPRQAPGGRHHRIGKHDLGAGDGVTYAPVAPFALTAESELTEDYFAFQTHQIDPTKDTVVAYSLADGTVEAMLLQDGAIKQIYRDPTQPGGWNIYTFPDATGVVDMVAGISQARAYDSSSQPGPSVLKVFYRTSGSAQLNIAVRDGGQAPSFTTTNVPWSSSAGPLQITVGFDESLLVTAMAESSSLTATDAQLYLYSDSQWGVQDRPAYGTLSGFAYNTGSITGSLPPRWSASLSQLLGVNRAQVQLALPSGTYAPFKILGITQNPPINLWLWQLSTNRPVRAVMSAAGVSMDYPTAPTSTTAGYSVEYSNPLGSINPGIMVVRTLDTAGGTTSQRLWVVSPSAGNGGNVRWTWTELLLPADPAKDATVRISTGVSPLPASEKNNQEDAAHQFMDLFVVADGTLSVIRQAPQGDAVMDYTNPAYAPAIPLQTGIAAMTSQANVSTGNELLMVGQDQTLQYLVKDPVTGIWTDNPVQLPASDVEETSAYRVTLGVVDAWQLPVVGQTLQVTASGPATALLDGAALMLGTTATTVTTDNSGQVILSLAADGLAAPTLTISGGGVPTTTVNPSAAVNTYLQGDTTLNYLPPLTADSLASATAADGSLVAPGASDKGAAGDAVTAMAQAASQAAGQVGATTLSKRHVHVKHRRDGHLRSQSKAELTGVLSDINTWGNDALHAIKKGAVEVQEIAHDAETGAFTIAGDFVHWAGNVVTVVVKTMEDAAHVVHAWLVKLGAEIEKAVTWIRVEVIGSLRDAAALGDQYLSWLSDCCSFVAKLTEQGSTADNAWLTAKQASVKANLLAIANSYATSTTLDTMADNPPQGASGVSKTSRGAQLGSDDGSPIELLHGRWYLSKIVNALEGELDLPAVDDLVSQVNQGQGDVDQVLSDAAAAFTDYLKFWVTAVTAPDKVMTVGVHDLLLAVVNLVDAAFELARGLATALLGVLAEVALALPAILQTKVNATPVIGGLLTKIGRSNTTVGQHLATSLAFPAVFAYKLAHSGQGRPFASVGLSSSAKSAAGDVNSDLKICAGAALAVWAHADCEAQIRQFAKMPSSVVSTAIDIAAPVIVGVLTVPSTQNGEPYFTPPVTSNTADFDNFIAWLASVAPGLWTAVGYYCEKTGTKDGKEDPDLPGQKRMALFATFASGVLSLSLGCAGNKAATNPSGLNYALAVLLNMSYLVVPLLDDKAVESSDGISALIAAITTLLTGSVGAALYAEG